MTKYAQNSLILQKNFKMALHNYDYKVTTRTAAKLAVKNLLVKLQICG